MSLLNRFKQTMEVISLNPEFTLWNTQLCFIHR